MEGLVWIVVVMLAVEAVRLICLAYVAHLAAKHAQQKGGGVNPG